MQEATATFTSTSECFERPSLINALIDGLSASIIDLFSDRSTFDKSFSTFCNPQTITHNHTTQTQANKHQTFTQAFYQTPCLHSTSNHIPNPTVSKF
ncbi:hypothetical protein HanRHA438_Chr10g0459641 [Helianthus annuus]|nr:hypothetical protein HanRHA438_Chr10g0459641 [Helianthus annuus]